MIDPKALLTDLQTLLKRLEADLLDRNESDEVPDVGRTLHAEHGRAKKAERTAANYEDWRSDAITQTVVAVLPENQRKHGRSGPRFHRSPVGHAVPG